MDQASIVKPKQDSSEEVEEHGNNVIIHLDKTLASTQRIYAKLSPTRWTTS